MEDIYICINQHAIESDHGAIKHDLYIYTIHAFQYHTLYTCGTGQWTLME